MKLKYFAPLLLLAGLQTQAATSLLECHTLSGEITVAAEFDADAGVTHSLTLTQGQHNEHYENLPLWVENWRRATVYKFMPGNKFRYLDVRIKKGRTTGEALFLMKDDLLAPEYSAQCRITRS